MVTAPNPPGSRASMIPPLAVFEIAPAKVLHGAVRLHGFASSPTPDTQVRVACACAGAIGTAEMTATPSQSAKYASCFIIVPPLGRNDCSSIGEKPASAFNERCRQCA